ncbi:MAG: type VI secretion system-associated protein TagF, partial [Serratia marcescens]|nr:type VI secretion system-associated protein TagF [Serratia marcescens]
MSTDSSAPTSIGWYGKLPSAGDFLQRRLPDPVVNNWAHWFHNGLVNLQRDAQGPNGHPFSNAPVWNFVIPATLGSPYVQMGCLLPARDRVGRRYPICALRLFSQQDWRPQQLNMAASWYQQL